MDRTRKQNSNKKNQSKRKWVNYTKARRNNRYQKIKKVIEKAQTNPLTKSDIISTLGSQNNFLGVFSSDELGSLRLLSHPVFLIVNVDVSSLPGSHWLAIRIGKCRIELFDSLGFKPDLWGAYPKYLLKFLGRYLTSHKFMHTPVLQPRFTHSCGLFCIYFIIFRQFLSFSNCVARFSFNLFDNNARLFFMLKKFYLK